MQRSAAPTGKALATGLAFQPLDAVRAPLAVTDERMKGRIRVAEVVALGPWTGVPGGAEGLGAKCAAGALAFSPGQAPGLRMLPTSGVGCERPHTGQSFGVRGLSGRGVLREGVETQVEMVNVCRARHDTPFELGQSQSFRRR